MGSALSVIRNYKSMISDLGVCPMKQESVLPGVIMCKYNNLIRICRIKISEFLGWIVQEFPFDEYRILKPETFRNEDFRIYFLSEDELLRLNSFKTLKKQIEWMCGRFAAKLLALKNMDMGYSSSDLMSLPEIRILTTEKGAPYIPDMGQSVLSISHSHDYAVSALIPGSGFRMGIDIERIVSLNKKDFIDLAFSEKEKCLLHVADDICLTSAWSMKESVLKLMGEGFHHPLKSIETTCCPIRVNGKGQESIRPATFFLDDGYVLTLAYEETTETMPCYEQKSTRSRHSA